MKLTYKIALVQAPFHFGDPAGNLARINNYTKTVMQMEPEARLVMFPELAVTGYDLSPGIRQAAQCRNGSIFQACARLASRYGIFLGYGYAEQGEGGKLYNAYQLIGPGGVSVIHYRKIHLPAKEQAIFSPGKQTYSVSTELGTIGVLICWDMAQPHLAEGLVNAGADLILLPAAWETPLDYPHARFQPPNFFPHQPYFAFCNQAGVVDGVRFFGHSSVCPPASCTDQVVAGKHEQIMIATIVLEKPSSTSSYGGGRKWSF